MLPGAAAGDDRDGHGFADRLVQRDVIARLGAIGIHAGEEDFAGAAAADFVGPLDRIQFRAVAQRVAAAVGVDGP